VCGVQAMAFLVAQERANIMHWLTTLLLHELDRQLQDAIPDSSDRCESMSRSAVRLLGCTYACMRVYGWLAFCLSVYNYVCMCASHCKRY
jgi:hypothetical protein